MSTEINAINWCLSEIELFLLFSLKLTHTPNHESFQT